MPLEEKLQREIESYALENELSVTGIDFLYAGPTMRSRHSLILAFTNVGIFTFSFRFNGAEMHYLSKTAIRQVILEKKRLVYHLTLRAENTNGEIEEAKYRVSKSVLTKKWHKQTLMKLIQKELTFS